MQRNGCALVVILSSYVQCLAERFVLILLHQFLFTIFFPLLFFILIVSIIKYVIFLFVLFHAAIIIFFIRYFFIFSVMFLRQISVYSYFTFFSCDLSCGLIFSCRREILLDSLLTRSFYDFLSLLFLWITRWQIQVSDFSSVIIIAGVTCPFLCFSYIFLFVRTVIILSRFSWFLFDIFFPFSQFVSLLFPSRYSFSFLFLYLLNLLICSPLFLQFLWVFYLLFYYFISLLFSRI